MRFMRTLAALGAMMISGLCACNIIGPAAYILEGPPTIAAQHELADVPTVVFIDDRSNVVNPVSLRRVIADKVSEELMVRKALTTTISSQDAMTLTRQRERNNVIMPMEEIAKL